MFCCFFHAILRIQYSRDVLRENPRSSAATQTNPTSMTRLKSATSYTPPPPLNPHSWCTKEVSKKSNACLHQRKPAIMKCFLVELSRSCAWRNAGCIDGNSIFDMHFSFTLRISWDAAAHQDIQIANPRSELTPSFDSGSSVNTQSVRNVTAALLVNRL